MITFFSILVGLVLFGLIVAVVKFLQSRNGSNYTSYSISNLPSNDRYLPSTSTPMSSWGSQTYSAPSVSSSYSSSDSSSSWGSDSSSSDSDSGSGFGGGDSGGGGASGDW